MQRREWTDRAFRWITLGSLGVILGTFALILSVIVVKGMPGLTWELVTSAPKGGYYLGEGGGIANAIAGTAWLAAGSTLLTGLLALPIALALQKEYLPRHAGRAVRLVLDVLWGTPSIVYGAVGFILMVRLGVRASLLGGILTLSLVMLPLMVRGMDEAMRSVSDEMKEVPVALGATRFEMVRSVLLRQALPGLFTALLLSSARGMGDAASVLFTAGFTDNMPGSILDPVASLPLAVFFQISSPVPAVQQRAYASALVLMLMVLAINAASRWIERRFTRHKVQ